MTFHINNKKDTNEQSTTATKSDTLQEFIDVHNKLHDEKCLKKTFYERNDIKLLDKELYNEEHLTKTFYEKNNIKLDNTLHGDPNSYYVTSRIVDYLEYLSGQDDIVYDIKSQATEKNLSGS